MLLVWPSEEEAIDSTEKEVMLPLSVFSYYQLQLSRHCLSCWDFNQSNVDGNLI